MLSSGNVFSYQGIIKNEIGIVFLPILYLTDKYIFYSKFHTNETGKRKYIVDFCADAGIQNMTSKKLNDFEFISTMKFRENFPDFFFFLLLWFFYCYWGLRPHINIFIHNLNKWDVLHNTVHAGDWHKYILKINGLPVKEI